MRNGNRKVHLASIWCGYGFWHTTRRVERVTCPRCLKIMQLQQKSKNNAPHK